MTQEKKNELLQLIDIFREKSERAGEAGELCSSTEWYDEVIQEQFDARRNLLNFIDSIDSPHPHLTDEELDELKK